MDLLRTLHGYLFNTGFIKDTGLNFLAPTPLALVTLILFVWSIAPAIKGVVGGGFMVWLRLTWVLTLLPIATGIILTLGGAKVPSSVAAAGSTLTRYGFEPQARREWEHWMYSALILATLYIIELLVRGKIVELKKGLRFLPIAALFLWGVAYMVARVAVFPGNS